MTKQYTTYTIAEATDGLETGFYLYLYDAQNDLVVKYPFDTIDEAEDFVDDIRMTGAI